LLIFSVPLQENFSHVFFTLKAFVFKMIRFVFFSFDVSVYIIASLNFQKRT